MCRAIFSKCGFRQPLRLIVMGVLVFTMTGCEKQTPSPESNELVIFHAGSLSIPFREISKEFNKQSPHIHVKAEAAGSRSCARKICDLKRPCDVMASADYNVVSSLLMPEYADYNIRFATNEMAIAYTDNSKYNKRINADNWQEILLKDEVAFGRSDPNLDPCGYRTLILFQLAEKHYKVGGLAEKLKQKTAYIRPKETDLLGLLEAGEIDYLFIYRSVAVQHGLKRVLLPDQINLKNEAFASFYKTASVKLSGKEPGRFITRQGESMVYSVTIPKTAPNPKAAKAWVAFLLSEKGRAIMEKNGQPCIVPAEVTHDETLPDILKQFCKKQERAQDE
jgi:molybdate/tungstate transport system substrate-binding protein